MLLKVEKSLLLKSVLIADSIIQGKAVNSAIEACLFKVYKDHIELYSTDNEISIKTELECESDEELEFTCDGKKLAQILKEFPDGEATLLLENNLLITRSSTVKGEYKLVTTDGSEFPEIEIDEFDNIIELNQAQFKTMIKKVSYAASHDSIKPIFNGIYFCTDDSADFKMVASDSRRLSLISSRLDNAEEFTGDAVIPLKTLNEVFKLLDAGVFKFAINDTQSFIQIGKTTIISRLIDGNFPDFDKVIPKEYMDTVIIDTKAFMTSLRRVMVFTREPTFKVTMTFSKDSLLIATKTPEYGEASEEIAIERSKDEEITIGINSQYLMDALKEIESYALKINITGQMSPLTLIPEDSDNYVAVIMPIQIKSNE